MDNSLLRNYRVISVVQQAISIATSLDDALREGLKIIVNECGAESAVLWYADRTDNDRLHPYYWIAASDLTSRSHLPGEGSVGRVYQTQQAERWLEFRPADDIATVDDFPHTEVKSMLCVPFSNRYENLGCIQFVNKTDGTLFTEEEADICEIMAMLAAIAIDENEQLQPAWEAGEVIMEIRGVTREFQNGETVSKILKGVNLDVYEGEFLVLLGESGCGKSTLLNIIGGMDLPTSGSFKYLGQEFSRATQEQLTEYRRHHIGFIFQSYNLMPNLNAVQNLNLIGELVDNPLDAKQALASVGLAGREGSYTAQLSGGQQQRVSIARALMKRPRIILADEPTAALDYATSIEVLSVLEEVVKSGTTLFMVTHNEEITRMADRVVRMRNGQTYEVTVNRHPAKATDLVW